MPLTLNGTTGVAGIDGSASTPSIQGTDTNTGVWFPAADTVAIATNGTERMRVDSSGNIGVGTSSPIFKLDISGNGRFTSDIRSPNFYGWNTSGQYTTIGFTKSTDNGVTLNRQGVVELQTDTQVVLKTDINIPLIFGTNASERARIDATGNFLIGTTVVGPGYNNSSTGACVQGDGTAYFSKSGNITTVINNNGSGQALTNYHYQGGFVGQVVLNGTTGVLYQTASDYRLKENVKPMQNALASVSELKPVTYTWKADGSESQGFIAHEIQQVVPDAVSGVKDGEQMQSVDYGRITPLLAAAIQELKAELDAVKAELAALKGAA